MSSIAVVGSRGATHKDNYHALEQYLAGKAVTRIVSGGARGADSLGALWAKVNNVPLVEHLPNYAEHGKRAPLVRNELIVQDADEVVAIWDGKSTGTAHTMALARKAGKKVHIIQAEN